MKNIELDQGGNYYKGKGVAQKRNVYSSFVHLLQERKPQRIIEIGTGMGGFTLFLNDIAPLQPDGRNTEIFSFELNELPWFDEIRKQGVKLSNDNIFHYEGDIFKLKEEYKELFNIKNKIVLCDGGNKIKEFNCLSDYLFPGDIIMAHDYCTDQKTFEEMLVWNWLEIQYSDIKESCERNKLIPYKGEEFLNCAWGSYICEG